MGSVKAYIPKGTFTDIFTLQKYHGPINITLNRELYSIPVLAKEGAVIPLSNDNGNKVDNPKNLEFWIFNGNNTYTLYEDNGKVDFEEYNVKTKIINSFDESTNTAKLVIKKPFGDEALINKSRKYTLIFKEIESASVKCNCDFEIINDSKSLTVKLDFCDNDIETELCNIKLIQKENCKDRVINSFSRWQENTIKKSNCYKPFKDKNTKEELLKALKISKIPKDLKLLLFEQLNCD